MHTSIGKSRIGGKFYEERETFYEEFKNCKMKYIGKKKNQQNYCTKYRENALCGANEKCF